ncbi:MAG: ornithine carbamoyltransferase [Candidatus Omnitrophica bacterium]|nr:ornithine carbamoyltransferase [Candidatus Omnitrophota bacterium]
MNGKRDLITLESLTSKEIFDLLKLARKLKKKPLAKKGIYADKTLALLFQKPSNRTRISFEVAMVHLGGYVLYLSPREISMGEREPVKDVARVVSRYVDGIVARVFSHKDVEDLACYSDVPVINGLSDLAHPCQALSDIFTLLEKKKTLKGVRVAYVGDGNNVLNSLLIACAKTGVHINAAAPEGYGPEGQFLDKAREIAAESGAEINVFNNPHLAVQGCDAIYTDVWVSMGQEDQREKRLEAFRGFQVNEKLLREANEDAVIMHCLPAHRGEEVSDVIDGKDSVIYDQAENRMHMQKAVLLKIMGK